MEPIKDDRFSHIASDPQYRVTPKSIRKVKIDKRFQSLFTDKRFQVKYTVDKRGRPVNQSSQENFKKYYELSSDDDISDENEREESDNVESEIGRGESVNTESEVEGGESDNAYYVDPVKNVLDNNLNNKDSKAQILKNKWVVTESSEPHLIKDVENNLFRDNENTIIDNVNKSIGQVQKKVTGIEYDEDKIEKARMTDEIKMKLRDPNIDYARGVGTLLSDSSSEEDTSTDSEAEDSAEDHGWGELDRDADTTEETTDRLACLHMDWDRIRAVDLMVLFNSFLPPEGVIESITIYPSQFGLDRMKEEEERGPPELLNKKSDHELELDEESKEGKEYHRECLRQYQLNRLKYYYAIIKFDSPETANKVYTECDGLEYESSATKLDLRFVPQEETFEEEPHETCTSLPEPAKYEPRVFTNTALQQGKVELTWDETDPSRQEFTKKIQKNVDNVDDTDLQAYLASSSEEDEECNKGNIALKSDTDSDQEDVKEEDKIAHYRTLLASLEEEEEKKKTRDVDLEITWGVGLKEKAEKSIKDKISKPQTPFEEILEKKRQKKILKKESKLKRKNEQSENIEDNLYSDDDIPSDVDLNDPFFKEESLNTKNKKKKKITNKEESEATKQQAAELELLLFEENDEEKEKSHFNFKSIQEQEKQEKKKKRRKQLKKKPKLILPEKDDFQVNVEDERFSALYTSHLFNVDPADPQFRKTKSMDAIISEKLKRRKEADLHNNPTAKKTKMDPDLSLLVKSIKTKCK